jgi:hypothetical protein
MKKILLLSLGLLTYGYGRCQTSIITPTLITTPGTHGTTSILPPNGSLTVDAGGIYTFFNGGSLFSNTISPTANIVTFQNGGIATGASVSNTSGGLINGYAAVVNPTSPFVLPLGNSSAIGSISINSVYSPLTVAAATGTISAQFVSGFPISFSIVLAPLIAVTTVSYFQIFTTTMSSGRLTFNQPNTGFSAGSTVCVAGFRTSTGRWEKISPNTAYSNGSPISTNAGIDLTLYSAITLGVISFTSTLPVTLVSFTGTVNGCTATLNWQTAEEQNDSEYQIESSSDGASFSYAGSVKSKNSPTGASYSYAVNLSRSLNYFRLKSADLDGKSTYSQTVALRSACGLDHIIAWPNPATSAIIVSGLSGTNNINIFDAQGNNAASITSTGDSKQINIASLASGTYILRVINEKGNVTNLKMVKK